MCWIKSVEASSICTWTGLDSIISIQGSSGITGARISAGGKSALLFRLGFTIFFLDIGDVDLVFDGCALLRLVADVSLLLGPIEVLTQ